MQSISVFLDKTKVTNFWQKCCCQHNSRDLSCDLYVFWIFFS